MGFFFLILFYFINTSCKFLFFSYNAKKKHFMNKINERQLYIFYSNLIDDNLKFVRPIVTYREYRFFCLGTQTMNWSDSSKNCNIFAGTFESHFFVIRITFHFRRRYLYAQHQLNNNNNKINDLETKWQKLFLWRR